MSGEHLVFASSVEALFLRGNGKRLTPELKAELRAQGLDLDRPLLPAYPSMLYQQCIDVLVARLYAGVPEPEAQFKLGESLVFGITETFVGRSGAAFSKLIGTRRALLRFPVSSMSSTNFVKMEAREIDPRTIELTSSPVEGHVEFLKGCISAAIELTGGREPRVELVDEVKGLRVVLRASWS